MPDLVLEPWRKPINQKPDITQAIEEATERTFAARVAYREKVKEERKMSLLGKMKHLTEEAQAFHNETEVTLDGIAEKIATGRTTRDEAAKLHHDYYDAIISGVNESTEVIKRLSNGPLSGDGKS